MIGAIQPQQQIRQRDAHERVACIQQIGAAPVAQRGFVIAHALVQFGAFAEQPVALPGGQLAGIQQAIELREREFTLPGQPDQRRQAEAHDGWFGGALEGITGAQCLVQPTLSAQYRGALQVDVRPADACGAGGAQGGQRRLEFMLELQGFCKQQISLWVLGLDPFEYLQGGFQWPRAAVAAALLDQAVGQRQLLVHGRGQGQRRPRRQLGDHLLVVFGHPDFGVRDSRKNQ